MGPTCIHRSTPLGLWSLLGVTLSSKIEVFCNKEEKTLNYLCCQFDGEGFLSFKVMAGGTRQEGVQCRLVIDLTSQGHSRSKITVPNEPSYVTSYMSIMVTNPLSCTIFEI